MYHYRILPDERLCIFTGRGTVLNQEIRETARKLLLDPAWNSGWNYLYDVRDADFPQLNYRSTLDTVKADEKHYPALQGGKVAVVANQDATYGTFRMYFSMALNRPQEVKHFRNLEEAAVYLGVPSRLLD